MKFARRYYKKWISIAIIVVGLILIVANIPSWMWLLLLGSVLLGVGIELYQHQSKKGGDGIEILLHENAKNIEETDEKTIWQKIGLEHKSTK